MYYSYIRSRAGLVALIFTLIISLVSAVPVPIPTSEYGLSSSTTLSPNTSSPPSLKGQPEATVDAPKFSLSGRASTLPAAIKALSRRDISTDMDDQLERRSIKSFFKKIGKGIKNVAKKIGGGIKKAAVKVATGVKNVAKKVGSGIKNVAKKVATGVKNVAKKVGTGVKNVARKIGTGVKNVAKKVATGVKTAAKKVGHFVKTTGKQVAKFGLKVVESVGNVAGHVASFIPGVGKGIQKAIQGVSTVAGVISDKIPAKLSPKLQKGMNVMNKANKIMSYIPRDLSEEEAAIQERDISDADYFQERDDSIELENREDSYFEAYERDIDEQDMFERDVYAERFDID